MITVTRSRISVLLVALTPVLGLLSMLALGGCASGGAAGGGLQGEVSSEGKISDRKISLRVAFDQGGSEMLDLREGETVTYDRLDAIYRITPRVSTETLGKIAVKVEVDKLTGNQVGHLELLPGEDRQLRHEFGAAWPEIWLRVVRIVPPLRPGSVSDRSGIVTSTP